MYRKGRLRGDFLLRGFDVVEKLDFGMVEAAQFADAFGIDENQILLVHRARRVALHHPQQKIGKEAARIIKADAARAFVAQQPDFARHVVPPRWQIFHETAQIGDETKFVDIQRRGRDLQFGAFAFIHRQRREQMRREMQQAQRAERTIERPVFQLRDGV